MPSNNANPWNSIVLFAPENMAWESNAEFYFYGTFEAVVLFEYSDAIVHLFRKFRALSSGKAVHTFPELSAVI